MKRAATFWASALILIGADIAVGRFRQPPPQRSHVAGRELLRAMPPRVTRQ